VQASPKSIIAWMDLLCRNYYCFRVMPYHHRLERALKKESKYYLWDWSEIESEGAKFENMIASHLLKFCDFYHFIFGIKAKLWYIRDRQGREVDFLVTWGEHPWFIVECKLKRGATGPLDYFGRRLDLAQRFLVTLDESHHYLDKKTGVHIIPASRFLMALI
jgi:predicted AAA+ superfamily ATPase